MNAVTDALRRSISDRNFNFWFENTHVDFTLLSVKNQRNYSVLLLQPVTAPKQFRPYFAYVGIRQTHSLKAVYRKRNYVNGRFQKYFSCVVDQGLCWLPHKPVNKVITAKTWGKFFVDQELNTISSLVGKKLPTRAATLRRKKKIQLGKVHGGPGLLMTHKRFKSVWNQMRTRRRWYFVAMFAQKTLSSILAKNTVSLL